MVAWGRVGSPALPEHSCKCLCNLMDLISCGPVIQIGATVMDQLFEPKSGAGKDKQLDKQDLLRHF